MGVNSSQELVNGELQQRPGSMRRSFSSNRLSKSKLDHVTVSTQILQNLKNEIDRFEGDRDSIRYKQFQEILTQVAKEIQNVKTNSKKQQLCDQCDEILGDVQNCLQRLETRVNFNLQNDNSLDMAAVESHSFINHGFNKKSPPPSDISNAKSPHDSVDSRISKQSNLDPSTILENLERATHSLDQEIRVAIETENSGSLLEYENKIKVLYAELEMVRVAERTQLYEKKSRIGKKLIKSNNQIKMFKKRLEKNPALAESRPKSKSVKSLNENKIDTDELTKIDHLLANHEIQVLTFDGIKDDKRYKQIEQILESYWTKVYAIDAIGTEDRERKKVLIERIKNILQELLKIAEENKAQNDATQQIESILKEVQAVKSQVNALKSAPGDNNFLKFDQQLRSCWAKLSDVKEPSDSVKQKKQNAIAEIQQNLINLSKNDKSPKALHNHSANTEKDIERDILQSQLVKQVEEFQNHWNHLSHNLNVKLIQKREASEKISDILQNITKEIEEKRKELLEVQKNQTEIQIKIIELKASDLAEPPINLTVKDPEQEIKVQPTIKAIGEIQRIGSEAKTILQQIRQSDCKKNDQEFSNFETSLKRCRLALESIETNKKSETIASSKQRVSKTLAEAFKVLNEKDAQKPLEDPVALVRSSKAQEIMDVDAEIHYFRQQIKTFTEVTKNNNYDKIKNGLNNCLNKLQLMDEMHIPKQDSIRQIQQYHQELETKLAENQAKVKITAQNDFLRRQTSQNVKQIIEQVQKMRSQVEKFTGVYKGLYYKQLEDNILKYLNQLNNVDVGSDEKLQNAVVQTKQRIQKYLNILEDKSIKTITPENQLPETRHEESSGYIVKEVVHQQKVHSISLEDKQPNASVSSRADPSVHQARKSQILNLNSPHNKINMLRDKLVTIKDETENFSGKYKDESYSDIEKKLIGVNEELKQINDDGHKSVLISKEQYADYIEKLMEYFENKTKVAEELQSAVDSSSDVVMEASTSFININDSSRNFRISDPLEELAVVEDKTVDLKRRIQNFSGTKQDETYKALDEEITKLMTELNNLETGNVAHVREKKKTIGQELHICSLMLEKQATTLPKTSEHQESLQLIEEIISEVEDINEEIVKFSGVKNDNEYCYLDEMLIKLTIKLDNINVSSNPELKSARKRAIQQIQENMKMLSQRAQLRQ